MTVKKFEKINPRDYMIEEDTDLIKKIQAKNNELIEKNDQLDTLVTESTQKKKSLRL